ncbi:hypothetical protein ACFXDE_09295 [Kitasatospora sp. NPDC059408]|uniref:hypothetical protein n=1 Tax=Kitasatospora sp. NPDC059408 TaxID=3346823 RepID=UPI003698B66C
MKRLKAVLGTGAAALAATASLLAGAGTAHADTINGCADGYVCIYADDGTIVSRYYTYGPHNLSNMYGYHYVLNNQTGGAKVAACTGYNGGDCGTPVGPGWYWINLTPINSIYLSA